MIFSSAANDDCLSQACGNAVDTDVRMHEICICTHYSHVDTYISRYMYMHMCVQIYVVMGLCCCVGVVVVSMCVSVQFYLCMAYNLVKNKNENNTTSFGCTHIYINVYLCVRKYVCMYVYSCLIVRWYRTSSLPLYTHMPSIHTLSLVQFTKTKIVEEQKQQQN